MNRVLTLVLCLLTAATAYGQAEGPINLRPQWEVGQTSRYSFWTKRNQQQTMKFQGESRTADSGLESEGEVTWTVDKTNSNGSYLCTMTFDWLAITVIGPEGEKQTCDSRKGTGDNPTLQDLVKSIVNVPLSFDVAADGTITGIKGTNRIKAKAKNKDIVPEDLDFIQSASELATLIGAPPELGIGKNWKTQLRWTHEMGHMDYDTTATLVSVEDVEGIPLATVETSAKLKLDVDRSELPKDGPPITIKLTKGEATSQVLFDLQRHETVGRNDIYVDTIDIRIALPQGAVERKMVTETQSQTLRISER